MKVYTKVVINMNTLEEDDRGYFEYEGEVALCKGGGGGAAGQVSYPQYLENIQRDWLISHDTGIYPLNVTCFDATNTALGSNPYVGATAFDPSTRLASIWTTMGTYNTIVNALSDTTDWAAFFTQAVSSTDTNYTDPSTSAPADIATSWLDPTNDSWTDIDGDWEESQPGSMAEIEADVDAYEDIVDDHVESTVLPRFQRGMQDINAVMTSAFTIGGAIIEGMADRDIAKYHGTLRVGANVQKDQIEATSVLEKNKQKAAAYIRDDELLAEGKKAESAAIAEAHRQDDRINAFSVSQENEMYIKAMDQMLRYFATRMQAHATLTQAYIEANRISIVAEKEEDETQVSLDTHEALWELELFQYGGNIIAGISGGTMVPNKPEGPTRMQSTLGGAMAGAATGAMATGTPMGAAIGGGIGAVMALYAG